MNKAIMNFQSKPNTSYVSHNKFSDWTEAEREFLMGYAAGTEEKAILKQGYFQGQNVRQIDWVEQGAVTPVQNQSICGSDWAFAVNGVIEAAYFQQTQELLNLSE